LDTTGVIQIIVLIVLLFFSGFFSSAETALTAVNKVRLEGLLDEGNKRAATALKLLENRSKMLSAILIMNNVINLSASALTTTIAMRMLGNGYIALATGILTLVLLVFGEITPKNIASIKSENITLAYSGIIYFLVKLLTPVIIIVDTLSNIILRLFGIDPTASHAAITEYEHRSIVDVSHEDGVIELEEAEMINNVVDFGDSCAKDIMIPRIEMTSVSIDASFDELKEIFFDKKYTRLPVYEDSNDNIVGIINMKDFLFYDNHEGFNIASLMREASYTFEYKKTSDLLMEMRQQSIPMIMVLDEYGATVGLVTLEDLLEEIVGDIKDEYDEDENNLIRQLSDREYVIDGSVKIDDINDALDTELTSEEYDSIGGLIIEKLEHIPELHESVILDNGIELVVTSMDKNHIESVKMFLPDLPPEIPPEENSQNQQ